MCTPYTFWLASEVFLIFKLLHNIIRDFDNECCHRHFLNRQLVARCFGEIHIFPPTIWSMTESCSIVDLSFETRIDNMPIFFSESGEIQFSITIMIFTN